MTCSVLLHSLLKLSLPLLLVIPASVNAAELKVFSTRTLVPTLQKLAPDFERTTGNKLVIVEMTTGEMVKRIQGGEVADLAIMAGAAVRDLAKQGKLASASVTDLGSTGISLAVRAGAPKPDISSVAAFKKTLLSAKSIAYSDPADGGSSGVHFAKMLQRNGLADQIKSKTTLVGGGASVGALAASGKVQLAIQMDSELRAAKGVDVVGPLPGEFQNLILYSAAIFPGSKNAAGAKSLIQLLKSAKAAPVLKSTGVQPAK